MGRQKRFKTLETAIGKYKATSAANDPIAKYKTFKSKGVGYEYKVDGTAQGTEVLRTLLPFGVAATGEKIVVPISGRVMTSAAMSANDVTEILLGLSATAATDKPDSRFIPAKVIIKSGQTTGVGTDKKSQITGLTYKNKGGHSYTYPFGQKTGAAANYVGALEAIFVAVSPGARTVSFKPEFFYR